MTWSHPVATVAASSPSIAVACRLAINREPSMGQKQKSHPGWTDSKSINLWNVTWQRARTTSINISPEMLKDFNISKRYNELFFGDKNLISEDGEKRESGERERERERRERAEREKERERKRERERRRRRRRRGKWTRSSCVVLCP